MKRLIIIIMSVFWLALYGEGKKPVNLSVAEGFKNPVGYSLENLSFSWMLPQGDGIRQTAYRIQVVSDPNHFRLNDVDLDRIRLWDSGKVESGQSVKVPFGIKNYEPFSGDRLFWRVKYWDNSGGESEWSDINFFEYGKLPGHFYGSYITGGFPKDKNYMLKVAKNKYVNKVKRNEVKPLYFRKEFDTAKEIKKARLYVASLGIYQAYVNGKKVGDEFWGTGWTDYRKRLQCDTYDVTEMLRCGNNVLAATLGDGWYSGTIAWRHVTIYGDVPALKMLLEIEYADGMRMNVATSDSWRWSYGPIQYSDIYMGEVYDARLEMDGWNDVGFDDSGWLSAKIFIPATSPIIDPRRDPPVRAVGALTPKSVKKIGEDAYIFDMGQNMVGWISVDLDIPKGKKITIRYAEMLNKDGTLYTENYRAATSRDEIIGKGGRLKWSPSFTFHGFRYVEVSGIDYQPEPEDVKGVVLHTDMAHTSGFECSDELINKLHSCIIWGQKSNFFSVPTDCPQRDERLGWTGDAAVFAPTAAFNMDVNSFYAKWTRDLLDAQLADGRYPWIAPDVLNCANGAPVWGDAGVIIPWEVYMAYGDKKILENNYEGMKKWVEWQRRDAKNFIRSDVGFGDWLQPHAKLTRGDTPVSLIATAYFAHTADLLSKAARVLGNQADAKKYASLSEDVKSAFNKRFVKSDGSIESDTQTAYLLPLRFDIIPSGEMRGKVFAKLLERIEKDGFHLNTGFVGTPHLNPVLTKFGRNDLACRLLFNRTYPSWLYPIMQGATTMWERWNSYSHKDGFGNVDMNSFNHYAYGAIGQWLYKDIGGLWYDEPGYKRILFDPHPDKRFSYVSVWHDTPYGRASSRWTISNGRMNWSILIPSNSEGRVVFRTGDASSVRVGGKAAPISGKTEDGYPFAILPSGEYFITYTL